LSTRGFSGSEIGKTYCNSLPCKVRNRKPTRKIRKEISKR